MYKRVMLKISGEALAGEIGGYDRELIETLGREVGALAADGIQAAMVTGGGNFWRGARSDDRVVRTNSDCIGMLATAMNAVYISDCFETMGIKTEIMSPVPIGNVFTPFSRQKALAALDEGKTLIFAFGTGHPYFSTDTSCALYGSEIDADVILALKSGVDGVYTKDPVKYPEEAVFIESITYDEVIADSGINVIDKAAACICRESGLKTIVLGFEKGNIIKAARGDKIGTLCY